MSALLDSLDGALDTFGNVIEATVKILEAIPDIITSGVESFVDSTIVSALLAALFGGLGVLAALIMSAAGHASDFFNIIDAGSIVSAIEETIAMAWDAFLDIIS